MQPKDFVWNTVYRQAISSGVRERVAKDSAAKASERYRKGQYSNKPSDLISECISNAIKVEKSLK